MNEQPLLNAQLPNRNNCLTPKQKIITGSICLVVGSVLTGAAIWHESDNKFWISLSKGVEDTLIASGTASFGTGAYLIYQGIKELCCGQRQLVQIATLDEYGPGSSRFYRLPAEQLPMGMADDLESGEVTQAVRTPPLVNGQ